MTYELAISFLRACQRGGLPVRVAINLLRASMPRVQVAFGIVSKYYD